MSADDLPEVDLLELIGHDTTLKKVADTEGSEYAGACPFCKDGSDRFRVQPMRHRWWCRQCSPDQRWHSAADYLMQRDGLTFLEAATYLREHYGTKTGASNGKYAGGTKRVTSYYYKDEQGKTLFRKDRIDLPDGKKSFSLYQPDPDKPGGWLLGIQGVARVLYRLPQLVAAPAETPILITEGEKCVEAVVARGYTATCNFNGAGNAKWRGDYNAWLRGRHVVVLPDGDAEGRAFGRQIAESVGRVAATVKVVELPGLGEKEDIYDWLAAGHSRDELDTLIAAAPAGAAGAAGAAGVGGGDAFADFGGD
jgi:DNA primase